MSSLVPVFCGVLKMRRGGETQFQGVWVGSIGYPDLVVVENSKNLHSLCLTVKLQQARDGLRGWFGIKHLEFDKARHVMFCTQPQ